MYECEHCGCRKTTLSGTPTYELRRAATGSEVVGERRWIFDTCSICRNERFFRQLEDDEAMMGEPHRGDVAEGQERLRGGGLIGDGEDRMISKATGPEPGPEPEPKPVVLGESFHGDGNGDRQDQVVPVMQRVKMLEGTEYATTKGASPKPTKGQPKHEDPSKDGDCQNGPAMGGEGDCCKGLGPLLDSVVEFLLEQSRYKDKTTQTEHEESQAQIDLPSTVEQLRHLVDTVSTVKRCSYQSIGHAARKAFRKDCAKALQAEGQFHTVSFTDKELLGVLTGKAHLFEDTALKLLIYPKEPMQCPHVHCPRVCFPSDLNDHLLSDHQSLNARLVGLRETKTLYMDPKALRLNEATCIQLYEVKDKITHPQAGWGGDVLPVLVMAARTRFSNDSDSDSDSDSDFDSNDHSAEDEEDALLVWLSSFRQADIRIFGTLSVWSPRAHMADTLTVLTAQPHDICAPKDLQAIFHSPATIIVPHALLQRMTVRKGGQDANLIAVQVHFH